MMERRTDDLFAGDEWDRVLPGAAGMDAARLDLIGDWLADRASDGRYRVVIVRGGRIVQEWNHGVDPAQRLGLASAAKSVFSCILGIEIAEGVLASADAKVIDVYPEAMDVPPGEGPKAGRHVFAKDHQITFRQLISNTSGYMKPGEEPGKVFHYQTYGMNILTHAIAKMHGLYDVEDPEGSAGFRVLVDQKLRIPIGAQWGYYAGNFELHPKARKHNGSTSDRAYNGRSCRHRVRHSTT